MSELQSAPTAPLAADGERTTQPSPDATSGAGAVGPAPARCPACEHDGIEPFLVKDGQAIARCAHCGLAFTPVEPSAEELPLLYSEDYFAGEAGQYGDYLAGQAAHRRQAQRYLQRLAKAGRTSGRLLDVGCAAGFFLDEARRSGWRVRGVEMSRWAARQARERFDLDVIAGDLFDPSLDGQQFDVITFFNVFEHLPDPARVVRRLGELLAPGGLLMIETWDRESLVARLLGRHWHQYSPRFVPYYYTRGALGHLFAEPGWRWLSFAHVAKWISVERGLQIVAGLVPERSLARRALERAAALRAAAIQLPYRAGDLTLALLERA